MGNLKTTITAAVGAIAVLLGAFGIVTMSTEIQVAIVTLTVLFVGLFAADAKTKSQ